MFNILGNALRLNFNEAENYLFTGHPIDKSLRYRAVQESLSGCHPGWVFNHLDGIGLLAHDENGGQLFGALATSLLVGS